MKIMEMLPSERPREKMLRGGAAALSDAELIAVLLGTGTRGVNVVDLSMQLLAGVNGSLEVLSGMSVDRLCETCGIGRAKAMVIVSAVELGRRLAAGIVAGGKMMMDNPKDAAKVLSCLYTTDSKEECWCLLLKRNRRLINSVRISEGGETMTEICVKTIVRNAIDVHAAAIILSHNHPGGDARPSAADIKQTMRLRKALETFDVSLMDHIIISGREGYSFSMEKCFAF